MGKKPLRHTSPPLPPPPATRNPQIAEAKAAAAELNDQPACSNTRDRSKAWVHSHGQIVASCSRRPQHARVSHRPGHEKCHVHARVCIPPFGHAFAYGQGSSPLHMTNQTTGWPAARCFLSHCANEVMVTSAHARREPQHQQGSTHANRNLRSGSAPQACAAHSVAGRQGDATRCVRLRAWCSPSVAGAWGVRC